MPEGASYFSVFGMDPVLRLDENRLRDAFYGLSKKLHPDRFAAGATAQDAIHSTQWSTLVNKAYQTLRDPIKRSHYMLELFGVPEPKTSQIPLDLAETYFEIQEEEDAEKLKAFRGELEKMGETHAGAWDVLAEQWGQGIPPETLLPKLREFLQKRRYLESMRNDVEKRITA